MDPTAKVTILMLLLISPFHVCVGNVDIKDISNKLSLDVNLMKNEELGVPYIEVCLLV